MNVLANMASDDDNVPEEIEQQCVDLHHAVAAVDTVMKPLLTTNRAALGETVSKQVVLGVVIFKAPPSLYETARLILCYSTKSSTTPSA